MPRAAALLTAACLACALDASSTRLHAQAAGPRAVSPAAPAPDGMVLVPAGEFWMGRSRLWLIDEIGWQIRDRADDRPVHRVVLPAFWLDTHEVTNARYADAVRAGAARAPYHWGGPTPPAAIAEHPVYNVSWDEASGYCTRRGGRLPTEAEWERAARGGRQDDDYPWGNDYVAANPPGTTGPPPRRAHSASAFGPKPVGTFPPNDVGLYDMSGNVWEWTADWYDLYYYSVSPVDAPTGPATGLYRVIRGGSWADGEIRHGSVYFRNFTRPGTRQPTVGFRCARSLPR